MEFRTLKRHYPEPPAQLRPLVTSAGTPLAELLLRPMAQLPLPVLIPCAAVNSLRRRAPVLPDGLKEKLRHLKLPAGPSPIWTGLGVEQGRHLPSASLPPLGLRKVPELLSLPSLVLGQAPAMGGPCGRESGWPQLPRSTHTHTINKVAALVPRQRCWQEAEVQQSWGAGRQKMGALIPTPSLQEGAKPQVQTQGGTDTQQDIDT